MKKILLSIVLGLSIQTVDAFGAEDPLKLIKAVSAEDVMLVKTLLKEGADVDGVNRRGQTPLIIAAYFNKTTEITKILLQAKANVNVIDHYDQTALTYAYQEGKLEIAKLLVQAGAGPEIVKWFSSIKKKRFSLGDCSNIYIDNEHIEDAFGQVEISIDGKNIHSAGLADFKDKNAIITVKASATEYQYQKEKRCNIGAFWYTCKKTVTIKKKNGKVTFLSIDTTPGDDGALTCKN